MRHFLLLLLAVTGAFGARAQQATYVMNGKTYYVYPYEQELEIQMRLFRMGVKQEQIVHRDSLNRKIVSTEVKDVKHFLKMQSGKAFRKQKKIFMALRRDLPGTLMTFYLPLEQDIVPTLEPLPDGDYVQFYRDLPYVSEDNVLMYRSDVVAGVFSLKHNQLNGYAYWLTSLGDTVKAGSFVDGLKEGPWYYNEYTYNTYDETHPKAKISLAKYIDKTYQDTLSIHAVYKNGLMDGPYSKSNYDFVAETGFYKNGEPSGEWKIYSYKVIQQGIKTIYTGEPVLVQHYFVPEKEIPVKGVIIRNAIIDGDISRLDYNLGNNGYFEAFAHLYHLYEEKEEEGLELPEEKTFSYPGEQYDAGMIYGDNGPATIGDLDFSYGRYDRLYTVKGKAYTRNQLIDSVGYVFRYEGPYEEYYQNGQLKMRLEIKDGKLLKEDTIFWDNGNPVNVINYLPATNEYEEKMFDYDQKLIYSRIYDAKGTYLRMLNQSADKTKHLINGKTYHSNQYEDFFEREAFDTLNHTVATSQTLFESLWRFDTTTAIVNTFDPETRTDNVKSYAIDKSLVYELNAQFGEHYENVSATETYQAGKLTAKTLMNGSYPDYTMNPEDTIPNRRVKYWTRGYELSSDYTLYYDDQPFSGKFAMTTHESDFSLKASETAIVLRYANGDKHSKAVLSAMNAYKKKHKTKELAKYLTMPSVFSREISQNLVYNLLPFGGSLFDPVDDDFFYLVTAGYSHDEFDMAGDYSESRKKLSEHKAQAFDKNVQGQFLNGKPSGTWTTTDQFGNLTAKVPFVNGEIDGTVYYYKTAYPEVKTDYELYGPPVNPALKDSFPSKPVHYLAKVCHYKNGVLNGMFFEMSWMGDTITKWNYADGRLDGPALERTKIAYTLSHYETGLTDGITQTYLTIPGKDTTLLFDLNFQNGLLQGESKSYHLNGHLAKHGFFLTGEPIDDYEAFDTLGFRYQYVKFEYNQPIEEKIWEENQLSVRYEFDWRDSIYFNTEDIAGSSSLERMLYDLGLAGDGYGEPYYGRPSLVDKTGIDYTMTKYYPNDTIARQGQIESGKKVGCWMFYNYDGRKLYEVEYYDSILQINDSVRFKSKGVLTLVDEAGQPVCRSYIVEKIEKYDCAHTDHHEIRMLNTFWERDSSMHRINGYVKNYFDNGVLMNEGMMKNGLATGVWKFYDPYGSLNQVGEYVLGKRQGRWLAGDLSQVKYMGDICLNPNLPNLDEILGYQEKLLDISVIYYQMTRVKKREYYGVNMNAEGPPENYYGDDYMEGEEMYYEGE